MKKIYTLLILIIMISTAFGQNAHKKWAIGLLGGKTVYNGDLGNGFLDFNPFYATGGLSIDRWLNPSIDLGIQASYGDYGYFEGPAIDFLATKTDVFFLLKYKLNNGYMFNEDALIAPYLTGGVGIATYSGARTNDQGVDLIFPAGAGVKLNFTKWLALQYQFLYFFTNGDKRDLKEADRNDGYASNTLGLIFSFGSPRDSDKDGVSDKLDKCPDTPLDVAVDPDGCPVDADNDGIADYLDKCPSIAGIAAFEGCPDSDGDGIQDSQDDCPAVFGLASFKGCPDTDGDGIKDSEDKCPNVKGVSQFYGCPDTDGDGITDAEDKCPFDKGTVALKGCPDGDKDGIADIDDKCPLVAGIPENKGCPAIKEETKKVFEKALRGIHFETAKAVIKGESFQILNDIVLIMQQNPEYNLEINGHCDAVGTAEYNQDLSQRRAFAVVQYLTDKGIAAKRMTAKGFGEAVPVADNETAAGRALNRRVEFIVVF